MHHERNHSAAKAFISFLIVAIAASMFFVFYNNQENIVANNDWQTFFTLAVVGAGLLVGLLYLVSNSAHQAPRTVKKKTSSKSSKKRKK